MIIFVGSPSVTEQVPPWLVGTDIGARKNKKPVESPSEGYDSMSDAELRSEVSFATCGVNTNFDRKRPIIF